MIRMECLDPGRLIAAVRRRPALWDPTHPLYGDKTDRARLWRHVCRDLVPDYEDLDDSLKKPWVNVVISRWKNVRDTYRKAAALRKVKGGVYRKYLYAEDMRFMDPVLKLRSPAANAREGSLRKVTEIGPQAVIEAGPSAPPPLPPDGDSPARPRESSSSKDFKNKQGNIEQQILQMLDRAEENEKSWRRDEDWLFFGSLLPSVRRLPSVARLRLRADVSRLVHAYALQYGLGAADQIKSDSKGDGAVEAKESALSDSTAEETAKLPLRPALEPLAGPAAELMPELELKPHLEPFQSYFTIEHEGIQYQDAASAAASGAVKEEPPESGL